MYKVCISFGMLLLSACTYSEPLITPSGHQGFRIDCTGVENIGSCYKEAGKICGSAGYEIIGQSNNRSGFFTAGNKELVVRCKAPGEQ